MVRRKLGSVDLRMCHPNGKGRGERGKWKGLAECFARTCELFRFALLSDVSFGLGGLWGPEI